MNAVVKQERIPQEPEGATLLAVISRAAADPQTDVGKMERLMAMYERIEAKRAETAFADALSEMQSELPSVGERGKVEGRYSYALWEDINAAVKPVLQKFGFALSFRTDFTDGIAITGVLTHRAGHSERTTIKLPSDPSGNKNAVQAIASSVSYGKRYTAGALLNLTSHGEDDDAFSTGLPEVAITLLDKIQLCAGSAELAKLRDEITNADLPKEARAKVAKAYNDRKRELKATA